MDMPNNNFSPKTFWEKPEGTTGMIFAAILLGALGFGLYALLPFIITLLQNVITTILLIAAICFIIFVITSKKIRTLVSYMYKSLMRKITGAFITIDPIGILKNYVADLNDNAENMQRQVGNLRGQMRSLKEVIDSNEREREDALKVAKKAKEVDNKKVLALKSRKAGRLSDSNMTLQALYNKMEMLYRVLSKMHETCLVLIEDLANEVEVKECEYKAINDSYSALKSAMRIVNGDSDQKAIFEQTMEYLADEYGQKLGEIEQFIDMSASFINTVDLRNGIYEEDALKMIEDWEQRSDSLLLNGNEKQKIIAEAHDPHITIDLDQPIMKKSDAREGKYNRYF